MKRKFLEDLGLEKDAVDKIIAENGADIENAKASAAKRFDTERDSLNDQITDLQAQVAQRDTDLSDIQTKLTAAQEDVAKLSDVQTSLSDLQSKYDTDRQAWEAKSAQQKYEFLVRERAGELNFSSTAAKREFIREAIDKGFTVEQDKILGFDDYVNIYKESDPGAFVVEKEPEPTPPPDDPKKPDIVLPGNSGAKPGAKSLSEMMSAKNANPNMVVSFDK